MKTLVIHPLDESTRFLSLIYKDHDFTVIRDILLSAEEYLSVIASHERVVCLGHGCPQGPLGLLPLFNDPKVIDILRSQEQNIYIWCDADRYLERHGLSGFCTGMFVSERREADYFLPGENWTDSDIDDSNNRFGKLVGKNMNLSNEHLLQVVLHSYPSEDDNQIIAYNAERLRCFSGEKTLI